MQATSENEQGNSIPGNTILAKLGKAIGLAGVILTIADFAQPIAPIAAYVIAASMLLLVVLLFVRLAAKKWNETLSTLNYFSIMSLVLGVVLIGFQNGSEETKKSGLIASNVRAFSDLQKSLGLVEKKLGKIVKSTASIDRKMDNVKKETSDNPRKELANMGISWNGESFVDAASQGNLKVLELFYKGGMRPEQMISAHNTSIVDYLIDHESSNTAKTFDFLISKGFDLKSKVKARIWVDGTGFKNLQMSPLGIAINKGKVKFIKYLRSKNVNTSKHNKLVTNALTKVTKATKHFCYTFPTNFGNSSKYATRKIGQERDNIRSQCQRYLLQVPKFTINKTLKKYQLVYKALNDKEFESTLDSKLNTGLTHAVLRGDVKDTIRYIKAGANPNTRFSDSDKTPLISFAAEINSPAPVVKALAENGANVNLAGLSGETALHAHSRLGKANAVKALLRAKADPKKANNANETATSIATKFNKKKILSILAKGVGTQ